MGMCERTSPEQAMKILEGLSSGGQTTRTSSRSSSPSSRRLPYRTWSTTSGDGNNFAETFPAFQRVLSDSARYDRIVPTTHSPRKKLAPYKREKAE